MTVAFLGTGLMGLPMAANIADAGMPVRAWNRTADKARPLTEHGAAVAATPAEAADGADLLVTMLSDGPTVEDVVDAGVLRALAPGGVWLQMSTVGLEYTERLAALAADAGVPFVDAPVLGTTAPARTGSLVVLASGPEEALDRGDPVFAAVGGRTLRLGEAGGGTRLKLVVNSWVLAITQGTAESVALAETLGVDPHLFLQAIAGGPTDSPYTHVKAEAMMSRAFPPSFPAKLAAKDARLVLDAAGDGADLGGMRAALDHLDTTVRLGYGDDDMAAMYYACRR
ncbi:MAG TPA: NAD(P)-dependent oxidoreductase [Streptosporangiaceae bacterium]|jgi:3-hydroxyisobutyrate dehydrogenase